MTKQLNPASLLAGGVLLIVGSLLVQVNMREQAPLGAQIWFWGTAALGVVAIIRALAVSLREHE
jgi:hypothetical protein